MNADEKAVQEFLREYPGMFVPVAEISRRLAGARRKFQKDKLWARPLLRRMELDGLVESNPYGEYRLRESPNETFKTALDKPGAQLGETTLISLDDPED